MTNSNHKLPEHLQSYSDEDLESSDEMQNKVAKLMEWFDLHGLSYEKYNPNKFSLDRKAYPNIDVYQHVPGSHNTQKWLQAISDIYRKEKSGLPRVAAIRDVVSGWNIMETFDFLNWVKFYEAGDHMKYKFAQLWYENDSLGPGYFLQVKKDPAPQAETNVGGRDVDHARDNAAADSERREKIEKQRNKIIGRLDSAEKLLRSPDGHLFSGKEFETLLEAIYQLKKKIQMVNKISSSTRLYEDMIVREANVLSKRGFVKAAKMLYSVAQTPGQSGQDATGGNNTDVPLTGAPAGDPTGAGNPGVPSGGAATPAQPPGNPTMPQSPPNETQPKGISEFLARMDDGQYAPDDDKQSNEDNLEVVDHEGEIIVEAQISPEEIGTSTKPAPLRPAPIPTPVAAPKANISPDKSPEPELEVTEDDIKSTPQPKVDTSNFDNKIDAVFANITVADVVAKLEDLSKIFKTREVPRQLGIVDMMLDSLGLASYFPSLAEATNRALDSNNYISTRVEDILSKLRGSLATKEVDLTGGDAVDRPEVAGIKKNLQDDEEKEKARKQMRRDQETAELSNKGKETPEVEIDEDLGGEPAAPPKAPLAV